MNVQEKDWGNCRRSGERKRDKILKKGRDWSVATGVVKE